MNFPKKYKSNCSSLTNKRVGSVTSSRSIAVLPSQQSTELITRVELAMKSSFFLSLCRCVLPFIPYFHSYYKFETFIWELNERD